MKHKVVLLQGYDLFCN